MNLPASAAGSFPVIVVTFANSVNADSAVIVPHEVVCGLITAWEPHMVVRIFITSKAIEHGLTQRSRECMLRILPGTPAVPHRS